VYLHIFFKWLNIPLGTDKKTYMSIRFLIALFTAAENNIEYFHGQTLADRMSPGPSFQLSKWLHA
jgi:hypothetical protein